MCRQFMGRKSHKEIITEIEKDTECKFLEIPTLPPSLMGYRLAETLSDYLKSSGVEIITGYPVDYVKTEKERCSEVGNYCCRRKSKENQR